MAFLTEEQLWQIGFKSTGKGVKISDKVSIYNPANIAIGNNVRIDDYCILSAGEGGIEIGNYVHIACFSSLIGAAPIKLGDFVGISGRTSIYSSNDDYSGSYLTNPNIPSQFKNVLSQAVILEKHALIGVGTVILPGVSIHEGAVVGVHSFVKNDCEPFWIYAGVPVKKIRKRQRKILELEQAMREHFSINEPYSDE